MLFIHIPEKPIWLHIKRKPCYQKQQKKCNNTKTTPKEDVFYVLLRFNFSIK